MMEEFGFDSSMPIDPSSLKALQELLLTPKRTHGKPIAKVEDSKLPAVMNLVTGETNDETKEQASLTNNNSNTSTSPHVPSEVLRPIALGRATSDLTMGLRSEAMVEEDTDASTAGSTQGVPTSMDKRILDQLQVQTALLLDLQRRVDELSQIVISQQGQLQQQHQGNIPPAQHSFNQARGNVMPPVAQQQPQQAPLQQQQPRNAAPMPPPPAAPQEPPQMFLFALLTCIPTYIRSTRVAEICRVYYALHRRDMGGRFDMNLIIKILFMGAILYAKFSASHRRKKNIKTTLQTYVAVLLIVGGFLLQSGYARFLQNFIFKERYVQRIWNGEQIDVAAQPPPRAAAERRGQRAQAEQEGEEEANAAGPGLLRGGIAEAPAQGGIIGKVLMDVVYLFGSFILSILPMWKAEAQQNQQRNGRGPPNGQENDGGGGGEQAGGNGGDMQG